jgi:hypothetical protein
MSYEKCACKVQPMSNEKWASKVQPMSNEKWPWYITPIAKRRMANSKMATVHQKQFLASFNNYEEACTMLCGKGQVRTQDLGYQAERYDHCATRPVATVHHAHCEKKNGEAGTGLTLYLPEESRPRIPDCKCIDIKMQHVHKKWSEQHTAIAA